MSSEYAKLKTTGGPLGECTACYQSKDQSVANKIYDARYEKMVQSINYNMTAKTRPGEFRRSPARMGRDSYVGVI